MFVAKLLNKTVHDYKGEYIVRVTENGVGYYLCSVKKGTQPSGYDGDSYQFIQGLPLHKSVKVFKTEKEARDYMSPVFDFRKLNNIKVRTVKIMKRPEEVYVIQVHDGLHQRWYAGKRGKKLELCSWKTNAKCFTSKTQAQALRDRLQGRMWNFPVNFEVVTLTAQDYLED